jgi:predicted CopG family antitoxin
MAVKTITIDLEAYDTLTRFKHPGQSFSDVIKQELGTRRTATDLAEAVKRATLAESTLVRLDRIVAHRKRDRARRVKL